MKTIAFKRKFLSIEPIMDFDLEVMTSWVKNIKPEICEIGYNNYLMFKLVEPNLSKTIQLIKVIKKMGITVKEKTIRKAWNEKEKK